MDRRFEGKVVAITGAGGGIGRAAAVRFASEGARIVAVDVAADTLKETIGAVERAGGEALPLEADVSRTADVERYVAAARQRWGGIDCFFNNAGILGTVRPVVEYPEDTFDRVIAVNLKGVWLGLKIVGAAIAARGGGAIVNTASVAGLKGTPGIIAYTASKHAVVGMTKTASLELVRSNVRVNAVCPAPIETAMVHQLEQGYGGTAAAARERLTARVPMQRFGDPSEVAALVAFLCSPDASYLNGGIYTVDGGMMA